MAGASQGDVEQAQVLAEALTVGPLDVLLVRFQHQPPAVAVLQLQRPAALGGAEAADERQEHQRVFQALGFVDGHHAHQRGIAFQSQHLFLGRRTLARQQGGEMADQRLFAVQLGGGLLQQLGQVQQVGQGALAVAALHQSLRQAEVMQQLAQHRQHALALPALVVVAELHDPAFPDALVLVQLFQLGQFQAQAAAGQRRAQAAVDVRLGASAQPQQEVAGLLAGQHRILV